MAAAPNGTHQNIDKHQLRQPRPPVDAEMYVRVCTCVSIHIIYIDTPPMTYLGLLSIGNTVKTFSWEGFVFCIHFMADLKSSLFTTSCLLMSD